MHRWKWWNEWRIITFFFALFCFIMLTLDGMGDDDDDSHAERVPLECRKCLQLYMCSISSEFMCCIHLLTVGAKCTLFQFNSFFFLFLFFFCCCWCCCCCWMVLMVNQCLNRDLALILNGRPGKEKKITLYAHLYFFIWFK